MRDQGGVFVVASVVFAVVWNAVAWAAMASAWGDRGREPGLVVFARVLVLVGLAAAGWAGRQVRVRWKYGRSVLELETRPGVVGGWLAGVVTAPAGVGAARTVRIELECVERRSIRGTDGKADVREVAVMRGEQVLSGELPRGDGGGETRRIPVAFEVPAGAPESGKGFVWKLRVRAGQRGADYDATFVVPVFRVGGGVAAEPAAEGEARGIRKSGKGVTEVEG